MHTYIKMSSLAVAITSVLYGGPTFATTINNGEERFVDYEWTDTNTIVGNGSDGTLTISDNGQLKTDYLNIGRGGATGIVNVINGGNLSLDVTSPYSTPFSIGGSNSGATTGPSRTGTGTLNISGAGSTVTTYPNRATLVGAGFGEGYMNVLNGGKFLSYGTGSFSGLWIGGDTGSSTESSGTVVVDGQNSEIWSAGRIIVGLIGHGSMTASNGGLIHTGENITIGNQSGNVSDNLLSVTGKDSLISATTNMTIGLNSKGTAVVSDSGMLSASSIRIASNANASGELAVGARDGESAIAAGIIDASEIRFGNGNGVITLNHTSNDFNLSSDISGSGTLNAQSGISELSGNNASWQGDINISEPATLLISAQQNIGNNDISMSGGELAITSTQDWQFINGLQGNGTLSVDTAGNQFSFASASLTDDFRGVLALKDTLFSLSQTNVDALKNTVLRLGSGSEATAVSGKNTIEGLVFDGGTLVMGTVTPGLVTTDKTLHLSGDLDISGSGSVQISPAEIVNNDMPSPDASISLLSQDDGNIVVQLVSGEGNVTGSAGNLQLVDRNGNVISDGGSTSDISQNGSVVAEGTWDYRLTGGKNNDGLYVNYGLTQVKLMGKEEEALVLDSEGRTGSAADLSARLTGEGDLKIDTGSGNRLSLSNLDNDYTGVTDIQSGILQMRNHNVLGQTSELRIAGQAGFEMNGNSQIIGQLSAAADSLLDFQGGSLTVAEGGEANGALTGGGELNLTGGSLKVRGDNSTLTAKTTIAEGASAVLDSGLGLGIGNIVTAGTLALNDAAGVLYNALSNKGSVELTGSDILLAGDNREFSGVFDIDSGSTLAVSVAENLGSAGVKNDGALVLNSTSDWTLNNSVTGQGSVTKRGSGTITVGSDADWSGATDILEGGLSLGSESQPTMHGSSQFNIAQQGMLSGFGGVAGNIDNAGMMLVGTGKETSSLTFNVGGNLINSGTVATGFAGQQAGNQLRVKGNYVGHDGLLFLNTVLDNDHSVTDKLIVEGDTSGNTFVSVTNAGGKGADTLNGIEVIRVEGASAGEFIQKGRIVAGAYDYSLNRGIGENSNNWYLNSSKPDTGPEDTGPEDTGPEDTGPEDTGPEDTGPEDSGPEGTHTPDLRPEAGSYTANLAVANTLFITRLRDRLGETQFIDASTGDQKVTSMWMRHVGGHNNWRDGSGQMKTQSNRYVVQLGGDIAQWSSTRGDRLHLGLMAGYGNDRSTTQSSRTHYRSKGSVDGYSAGLHLTWYASDEKHNGLYVDTWALYSWFNNSVKGQDIQSESYKSEGLTGSLELGYTHKLGEFTGSKGTLNEWYIQPQAQAVWMGVKADGHREANGTLISGEGDGNVQTRLGVRTFLKGHSAIDDGKDREFKPFVEVNWLHNTRNFGTRMDGVSIRQAGARNMGEIKTGVEGKINPKLNIWGNTGVQIGGKGYNDASAMVGVKYSFK